MCPWKPFWLATDLAICRWLTSVQIVCEVGLGIRKGRCRWAGKRGLLFQETAILLEAGVPATRLHAERLPCPTIGNAGRYRASIEALVAGCNAGLLLAAAPHGGRECGFGTEQGEADQDRYNERIIECLHGATTTTAFVDSFG